MRAFSRCNLAMVSVNDYWLMAGRDEGRYDGSVGDGIVVVDGRIGMPCPQPIGGRPRPSGLVSLVGTCVAAPTGGVNVSTIVGSPRGSSATKAGVDTSVSSTPVRVRSTVGPPAMVLITGTIATVPVSAKARYSDGVLDRCPGSVSASSVSSTTVKNLLRP
jgi:hypothetical protein